MTARALANLAGIPMPCGVIFVDQKRHVIEEAMNWVRSTDTRQEDLDKPSAGPINLAGKPLPLGKMTPATKKEALDFAVQWLRNSTLEPQSIDDPTAQALANLAGIPLISGKIPASQKRQARSNDPKAHVIDEPSVRALLNLASIRSTGSVAMTLCQKTWTSQDFGRYRISLANPFLLARSLLQ
jgi:hypothetical protein